MSEGLERVRQAAERLKDGRFTALLHHVTPTRLKGAYRALNPKASPGVDKVTWEEYGEDLENKIEDLHGRIHRGAYQPYPSKRGYIPKPDGGKRPLGIAALEDKIAQRALSEVMSAIYEVDFLGFSYGFRAKRCAHDALDALYVGIMRSKVEWVLDADIRSFFDSLNHEWLLRFIEHRIGDKRVTRLIRKWLKAGIMEEGKWQASKQGAPQGASLSPLLANIYLHYVFDLWAHQWRNRKAQGQVVMVRYADDFVVGFQYRSDAEEFLKALGERLEQYGLSLHEDKTRLIRFGRHARQEVRKEGKGKPETFDFLGFTHISGRDRHGRYKIIRKTIRKRLIRKLKEIKGELRKRLHDRITSQGIWLRAVLQGYFNYFAVPDNWESLETMKREVTRTWYKMLRRRSQRTTVTWAKMSLYAEKWIPHLRIIHPWPDMRFDARTGGKSPVR